MTNLEYRGYDGEEMIGWDVLQHIPPALWPTKVKEVMQWTGLTDKNGVKVFEGDRLGGSYESLHVNQCPNQGGFELYHQGDCFACGGDILWYEVVEKSPASIEVIGNIHQHKDLL